MRALPVLLLSLPACFTVDDGAVVNLAACAQGADVDDVTHIAWDFETSAHEMIVCGGLSNLLIQRLVQSATGFARDPYALPGAFSYADGVYTTQGQGVSMDLWFEYGADTPVGEVSVRVEYDLFELDTYLRGSEAAENSDGSITVTYEQPGPLVTLLGQGDLPPNPLTIDNTYTAVLAAAFGTLRLRGQMHVDDEVTLSTITYDLDFPDSLVFDLIKGEPLALTLVSASGFREDLGQELSTRSWDIVYRDQTGALDGVIDLEVRGGPFDFRAHYQYFPVDPEPLVTISCL